MESINKTTPKKNNFFKPKFFSEKKENQLLSNNINEKNSFHANSQNDENFSQFATNFEKLERLLFSQQQKHRKSKSSEKFFQIINNKSFNKRFNNIALSKSCVEDKFRKKRISSVQNYRPIEQKVERIISEKSYIEQSILGKTKKNKHINDMLNKYSLKKKYTYCNEYMKFVPQKIIDDIHKNNLNKDLHNEKLTKIKMQLKKNIDKRPPYYISNLGNDMKLFQLNSSQKNKKLKNYINVQNKSYNEVLENYSKTEKSSCVFDLEDNDRIAKFHKNNLFLIMGNTEKENPHNKTISNINDYLKKQKKEESFSPTKLRNKLIEQKSFLKKLSLYFEINKNKLKKNS